MQQAAFGTLSRALINAATCAVLCAFAGTALANSYEEAGSLYKAGQHAKALEQIEKHLADQPKDAQGRFLKGIILSGMNRLDDALAIFKKLTEDYPDLPDPYNNLAVIYAQQKQYDKARDALEQAIRTHPAYATAYENLGDIHSLLASQAYGKALQLDAANASAQTKLALINDLVGNAAKPGATRAAAAKTAEPAQTPPADIDAEITAMIDDWLAAWSKKDVKRYLGHYARDFVPPDKSSRKDWEAERTLRVGKPDKIEVSRGKLTVKTSGQDKATASFRQNYVSASFKAASNKSLQLVKRDGKWQIQQELVH